MIENGPIKDNLPSASLANLHQTEIAPFPLSVLPAPLWTKFTTSCEDLLTPTKSRTVRGSEFLVSFGLFSGFHLRFLLTGRSPKDFEHKVTKKTKDLSCPLYSLRFLCFLLFIPSVPSA
jgi:hypothetical protein